MKLFTNKKTFYEILQVSPDSNLKEIKSQYFKLCKLLHPDLTKRSENSQDFQDILTAYETLKDDKKRREYDRTLALVKYQKPMMDSLNHFEFKNEVKIWKSGKTEFWSKMAGRTQGRDKKDKNEGHENVEERLKDIKVFRDRFLVVGAVLFGYFIANIFKS